MRSRSCFLVVTLAACTATPQTGSDGGSPPQGPRLSVDLFRGEGARPFGDVVTVSIRASQAGTITSSTITGSPITLTRGTRDSVVTIRSTGTEVRVSAEAVDGNGLVVARGGASVTPIQELTTVEIALVHACSTSAECDDGRYCTTDTCGADGTCVTTETCAARQDGCVTTGCDESARQCLREVHDGLCGSGGSCDPATGRCRESRCSDTDDGNACTVDACGPTGLASHTPLATGTPCVVDGDSRRHLCRPVDNEVRCLPTACGDGILDSAAGEQCDDGNPEDDDGCTNACAFPRCGDGVRFSLDEECDDGNGDDTDACIACRAAVCGDGYVNRFSEQCDDGEEGLLSDTDGCDSHCRIPRWSVRPMLGCVDDRACLPLDDVQAIAWREGGEPQNEFVVVDRTGFRLMETAVPQLARLAVRVGDASLVPSCQDAPGNPRLVVTTAAEGAPDTRSGVRGVTLAGNALTYQSSSSDLMYRLRLEEWGPGLHQSQLWVYVAGEYGPTECCPADFQFTWRGNRCTPCRDATPSIPSGLTPRAVFHFLDQEMLVATRPSADAMMIVAGDDVNCPGQQPNVELGICGGAQAPVFSHVIAAPAGCGEESSQAFVVADAVNHRVVRVGLNLPLDLLSGCISQSRPVAGRAGIAGAPVDGALALESALNGPTAAGQDAMCNVFIADTGNEAVRVVEADGTIHTVAVLPGLRTIAVHPTLGVLAATENAVYLITQP